MMRGTLKRFQQQRAECLHCARRNGNLFQQIIVADEKRETALSRGFDLIQIFRDPRWRVERFGQRPLERIIPQVCSDTAESLFDGGVASEEMFTAGINGKRP